VSFTHGEAPALGPLAALLGVADPQAARARNSEIAARATHALDRPAPVLFFMTLPRSPRRQGAGHSAWKKRSTLPRRLDGSRCRSRRSRAGRPRRVKP
jgi:hypothetical protein